MLDQPAAMHVARIESSHTDKQGPERHYESALLRHTYRDGGKVRHKTLANLSAMPGHVVDTAEAALTGEVLVPVGQAAVSITRSLPHGHVAAMHAMARRPGSLTFARPEQAITCPWRPDDGSRRNCPGFRSLSALADKSGGIREWHFEWQMCARRRYFQLVAASASQHIALSAPVPAVPELRS
jgi:hypothetical protein